MSLEHYCNVHSNFVALFWVLGRLFVASFKMVSGGLVIAICPECYCNLRVCPFKTFDVLVRKKSD